VLRSNPKTRPPAETRLGVSFARRPPPHLDPARFGPPMRSTLVTGASPQALGFDRSPSRVLKTIGQGPTAAEGVSGRDSVLGRHHCYIINQINLINDVIHNNVNI
jgi:hypothetical protein